MGFSIRELADRAGVTPRTIRYYVELGLLPPPSGPGPKAEYGEEHLDRLYLIRKLQTQRLSLEEIREFLAEPDSEMAAAEGPSEYAAAPSSAAEYISQLRLREGGQVQRPSHRQFSEPSTDTYTAEPWMRIPITADVELNIRRRGSRIDTRLARAIEELKRIFSKEEDPK